MSATPHLVPLRKAAINCESSHPSKSCGLAIYTILLSFGLVFSFFVFVLFCVFSRELREEPEISGPCPELWVFGESWPSQDWLLITSLWNILELQFYKTHVFFHLTHL